MAGRRVADDAGEVKLAGAVCDWTGEGAGQREAMNRKVLVFRVRYSRNLRISRNLMNRMDGDTASLWIRRQGHGEKKRYDLFVCARNLLTCERERERERAMKERDRKGES